MERDIIRDIIFLQRKSEPACAGCAEDMATARDLYDTLAAHQAHCALMNGGKKLHALTLIASVVDTNIKPLFRKLAIA